LSNTKSQLALAALLVLAACDDPTEGVAPATVAPAAPTTTAPATPTPPPAARETLTIDRATSSVGFTGSKVTGSHDGTFGEFSGTIDLDAANLAASAVRVTIQMGSVTIEPARLQSHLRSGDFFDIEHFPTATFESTSVTEGATGTIDGQRATHTIAGNLTLRGQTRAVTFPAIVSVAPGEVTARSEFTIDRRDFSIVYPGMPDDLIRDEVVIRFSVRAPRAPS
jgi:polyisoprenoid-binding protein YceI